MKTGKEEMASTLNNDPVPDTVINGPRKKELRMLAEGYYETAKYMILKNKKR
jgi:hypothetical protein